jgi:hypothetical protein
MSSAVRGLIPKSSGGRMALGGMGALGLAAGVRSFNNRSSGGNSGIKVIRDDRVPRTLEERRAHDRKYMSMGGMTDQQISDYHSKYPPF